MKFLRDTTWEEVFQGWKDREGGVPGWIRVATKKGWPDWESWRRFSASLIHAETRSWQIFQFTDPSEEVSRMLVGPYAGWQFRVVKKNETTFAELVDIPEQNERLRAHPMVQAIRNALPFSTEMFGLVRDDNQKIVSLDGHHRATAIALAKREGDAIDFRDVNITIALAHLQKEEISLLDDVLARGSTKNSVR